VAEGVDPEFKPWYCKKQNKTKKAKKPNQTKTTKTNSFCHSFYSINAGVFAMSSRVLQNLILIPSEALSPTTFLFAHSAQPH
jgi:hypothetical protein